MSEGSQNVVSETPAIEQKHALQARIATLEQQLERVLEILSDEYRFGKLRSLLAEGDWKAADLETTRVMVEIAGSDTLEEIAPDAIKSFPCSAIAVIDNLWLKYSKNRFGFSHQLRIYLEEGGSLDAIRSQDVDFLQRTSAKIGWRKNGVSVEYDDYNFSLEAPIGGLPSDWWHSPYGAKMANFFMSRLISCDL